MVFTILNLNNYLIWIRSNFLPLLSFFITILSIRTTFPFDAFRSLLWRQHLSGVVRIRSSGRDVEFASPWCTGHPRTEYREIAGLRQISQDSISEFPRGE